MKRFLSYAFRGVIASYCVMYGSMSWADDSTGSKSDRYSQEIKPLLERYCYDCHGYGSAEGNFQLDELSVASTHVNPDAEQWWKALRNLRAGVMPPVDSEKPTAEEVQRIAEWIKFAPFGIEPDNPDPGRRVVRRLNRAEYGNSVRELMGIDFDESLLFPPDDSGHGFDNVADALMVSPLLMEKYFQAATAIVDQAVPKVTKILPRQDFSGRDFADDSKRLTGRRLDGKQPARVAREVMVDRSAKYAVHIAIKQHGSFNFDPARYQASCAIDGQECFSIELGWDENKLRRFDYQREWEAGPHEIVFEIEPLDDELGKSSEQMPEDDDDTFVSFEVEAVSIEGPLGSDIRVHPENYERFFSRDRPPQDAASKREYARETLHRFAKKAYRGRIDEATLERLVDIAAESYSQAGVTFEAGVAKAMVAVLASPRFLFRLESLDAASPNADYPLVDEIALASRLSYLIWSSMPDDELLSLAERGRLRAELPEQVERMLNHPQADQFVSNFVGQWLRTRDVPQIAVDPAVVLGVSQEYEELRDWRISLFRRGWSRRKELDEAEQQKMDRYRELRELIGSFDSELRDAIRNETEMFVEHVVREDRSLLDLLDCDYTFLNEKLAKHYGVPGVQGKKMRLVDLPAESPRGGVLTQASMLLVTSNPTRTSPVKRGLFVLENILGTPAPPAPGGVPELEASADRFEGRKPSLRELLAVHRESDLCSSCHSRMDPLGLALENFDALGMWRELDGESKVDPSGVLITGEEFADVRELKHLLREKHAHDFYRCVAEKMLIYATGRGVEYRDEHTLDLIVERLKAEGGTFRALLFGVIESAPFQRQRAASTRVAGG